MRLLTLPTFNARLLLTLLLGALLMLAAACGDDDDADDIAEDIDSDSAASGSPTSGGGVDEDVEEVEITIAGGEFSDDEVTFQLESPAVLTVKNDDDVAYMLGIEDLVSDGFAIAPGASTLVEFTTSVDGEYEARLTAENGSEPLDTMTVVVQPPGGVDD